MSRLPSDNEKATVVRGMFDRIAPRYDLVNRVMTFGMDTSWRRKAVVALRLPPGAVVLDIACGTGDLCRVLEVRGLRPIGLDFSAGMLKAARTDAPLVRADALRLPVGDGAADGITCGFALRNFSDLDAAIGEFARILRPGGHIAILEVSVPRSAPLRAGHQFYFRRVVPVIGGLLSDRAAYRYLPESTVYLPPTAELLQRFDHAGFSEMDSRPLSLGAAQLITGTKR